MAHATLCIQCLNGAGQRGDFLRGDDGADLSPTFLELGELFQWLKDNGWRQLPYSAQYPTGRYERATETGKA